MGAGRFSTSAKNSAASPPGRRRRRESNGEVASRLAAETALASSARPSPRRSPSGRGARRCSTTPPRPSFSGRRRSKGRMATTLLASLFRHDKVTIAHVGRFARLSDPRGENQAPHDRPFLHRLQVKLGLLLERNAMTSPHRSTLTRSIGYEPMCHYDIRPKPLLKGDIILQCRTACTATSSTTKSSSRRQVSSGRSLQTADRPGGETPGQRQRLRPDRPGLGCRPAPTGPCRRHARARRCRQGTQRRQPARRAFRNHRRHRQERHGLALQGQRPRDRQGGRHQGARTSKSRAIPPASTASAARRRSASSSTIPTS